MSTEFNSAQNNNERKTTAGDLQKKISGRREPSSTAQYAAPAETVGDSELDIQELLKKYLPEYADEEPVLTKKETVAPVDAVAYEGLSSPGENTPAEEIAAEPQEEDEEPTLMKKSGGLFAWKHHHEEQTENVAPDSEIFDQISEEISGQPSGYDYDEIPAENPLAVFEEVDDASAPLFAEEIADEVAQGETVEEMDALHEIEEAEPMSDGEQAETVYETPLSDESSFAEPVMDDTDINLMVAFGLEEQLEKTMGVGAAEEAAARVDAVSREHDEQQRKALEYEYTERSQTPQIADAYKYALGSLKIKIAAAALLSIILFFYENITLFGVQFAGALDPAVYPVVHIMMSLQIMLLTCAIAYEQIFTGFTNLVTLRPTPESALSVLAVFSTVYSVILACTVQPGVEPVLYNFPVAVTALMALLFTYFNTKREAFSFNIVSSKRQKYIFRRISPMEGTPESRIFGAVDEDSPDVLRITRTSFVDGYFDRTDTVLHTTRVYVGAMLSAIVAASVLMAVFAGIGGSTGQEAVTAAYLALIAGLPMSMFFTYSYPFYKANREAYACDSTIVGERSLEEYAGASIVSFEDKNVFPSYSVKVRNIKIYNNNRIDRVLYYAASAFSAAGGPLADVFDLATMEMGHSDQVEILSAGVGYLETNVDGRRILFGRSHILTELGYDIPVEIVEEDSYVQGDLSILYMLRDGNLIAKMYVRYVMDADFEFILRQFARGGTCVCVKTFDPNIDEEMIFSKVRGKKYPLKVVRNMEGCETTERADSGIVTRGTTKSLLQVVSYCDMVLGVKSTNLIVSIVSAIVSLAIVFIVTMSKNLGALQSWMVVLNQIFWMLPAMLTTKLFIK